MSRTDEYITLSDVYKRYESGGEIVSALKGVSLTIKKGEFIAIVGPSGSGKTTLMNTIGCLDDISSGQMSFYGIDVSMLNEDDVAELRNKYIGFVFQKYNLLPYLTAKENVALPAQYTSKNYKNRNERAEKILESVGLSDRVDFNPNQLSGGQQQRVSIARALMNDADIILADEPTGALDSVTGCQVMDIFKTLNRKGKTIILVTHDNSIASQADRIISMNDGRIAKDESSVSTSDLQAARTRAFEKNPLGMMFGIVEAFRTAFRALNGHRIRAFLSMLGVIIGVFAVLMSIAISEGAHHRIMKEMNLLDTNTIEIRPGTSWKSMPDPSNQLLEKDDVDMLTELLPESKISPVMTSTATVNSGDGDIDAALTGISKEYFDTDKVLAGHLFETDNITASDAVAVIDSRLAETAFGSSNEAVGKYLQISGYPFEVVGVIKDISTASEKTTLKAWIPWTSYINRITGLIPFEVIQVRAKDQSHVELIREKIEQALTFSHGKKDFFTVTNESVAEMIVNVSTSMKLLTVAISTISLLVGGVGVMNIMFVSVTERIHEIGIRLSVGASPVDIKRQFLIESVFICFLGGAVGVALTSLASIIFPLMTNQFDMILTITPVVIACAFSCFIGIVFGYVPAKKASSYTPAKALGYK
ncbi:ATP-binding cassette domain-containing protein [Kosakonia quasisacchari]|uniref:ATP-binding cassette domain-containing protein n=1 Tax=Kosakonia quasisacchari TaxID=2529380 RepID=A0A4R0H2Y6_9ENTR|nr:ATP-binding cassette domain-containing protein [Kosakonia quasisacchari]TCC04897.1 ATP-binding cassette domain-containing protein [Kosakonia quasisacchari]